MQVWQDGVLHGQEINAAQSPHAQSGIQGGGCIGGPARRPYISARPIWLGMRKITDFAADIRFSRKLQDQGTCVYRNAFAPARKYGSSSLLLGIISHLANKATCCRLFVELPNKIAELDLREIHFIITNLDWRAVNGCKRDCY